LINNLDDNKFNFEEQINKKTDDSNQEEGDNYNEDNIFKFHKRMFSEKYKEINEKPVEEGLATQDRVGSQPRLDQHQTIKKS